MSDYSNLKSDSKDFHKILNSYFLKEKESNQSSYRKELSKIIFDYIIKTDDGSYTINSPDFDGKSETMHNSNGAITESFEKFVKPLKFDYSKNKEIAILDICGGFGYNSAAVIADFLEKSGGNSKIAIDMIEISLETLATALVIPSPIATHNFLKSAIESKLVDEDFAGIAIEKTEIPENIAINVHIEDARKTIIDLKDNNYDAIFFDPYSPAMAPELCSVEFFKELKRVIKDNGIIATYSASSPVRWGLIEAGFYIGEGPIFGRKSGGTIASIDINNINNSIPLDDERTIAISDAGIPFRDPNLNLTASQILNNRKKEREKARHHYKISSAVQTPLFLGKDLKDEKLKRRLIRNLNKVNISDLKSDEAYYIIEPQNSYSKESTKENNSNKRIIEMNKRLLAIIDN